MNGWKECVESSEGGSLNKPKGRDFRLVEWADFHHSRSRDRELGCTQRGCGRIAGQRLFLRCPNALNRSCSNQNR